MLSKDNKFYFKGSNQSHKVGKILKSKLPIQKGVKIVGKFFKNKFDAETLDIKLINDEYIEHKLSHILIKSSFWFTKEKTAIDEGIFTTILDDYPMSKLMHKFIEKYNSKFAYSGVKLVN